MTVQIQAYLSLRETPTILEERTVSLEQFIREPCEVQVKLNGERLLCKVEEDQTLLLNRHSWTGTDTDCPRLTAGIRRALNDNTGVVDGELVAKGGFYGKDGFLENRANRDCLTYVVFDLIGLNGENLRNQPYLERFTLLRKIYKINEVTQLIAGVTVQDAESARRIFKTVTDMGEEGVIVKPHSSLYVNNAWLKVKKVWEEDCVIVGIRKTDGFRRTGVASSWLIQTKKGEAKGCVGSGLDYATRKLLTDLLLKAKTGEDGEFIYCQLLITLEVTHNGELENSYRSPRIVKVKTE